MSTAKFIIFVKAIRRMHINPRVDISVKFLCLNQRQWTAIF